MNSLLIENWRSYIIGVDREEKRRARLQEAIDTANPKIVQILQKEVEETAAILRQLFALNKQIGEYYNKAPEKNERNAQTLEQKLVAQVFKPFEDKEEKLEALVDQTADMEPIDLEKYTQALDTWSDHIETMPEVLKKLFAVAQKNGIQLSKPYVKMLHDAIEQDLEFAKQNLKNAMQGLEAAKQGKIGSAALGVRR